MIGVGMNIKSLFFDKPAVTGAMDRQTQRALSKFGAYVRRRARSSIRRRKSVSPPGRPPRNETGILRESIFFSYDRSRQTVVIGPVDNRGRVNQGPIRVPELLEFGGTIKTMTARWIPLEGGGIQRRDRRGRFARGKTANVIRVPAGTRMRYRARPYMGPAFKKVLEQLPQIWAGAVTF